MQSLKAPVREKGQASAKNRMPEQNARTECAKEQNEPINSKMKSWIDTLKGTAVECAKEQNARTEPIAGEPIKSGTLPTIDFDDIVDEICYWESAMICYVLGANPPLKVMEGFSHRMWKHQDFDKLVGIGKGVYLARFHTKDNMLKVANGDHIFFDSKPLIMKPWSPDIDVMKDEVKTIPMWIKLPGLDLKYWGVKALTKICSGVGKFIKPDNSTLNKDKLQFARILIETDLDAPLPDTITFINEKGCTINQVVQYDWKPVLCTLCKRFGHEGKNCKRGATATIKHWVPKVKQTQPLIQTQQQIQQATQQQNDKQQEHEGFTAIKRKASSPQKPTCPAAEDKLSVTNKFDILTGENTGEPETKDGNTMPFEVSATHAHGELDNPPIGHG